MNSFVPSQSPTFALPQVPSLSNVLPLQGTIGPPVIMWGEVIPIIVIVIIIIVIIILWRRRRIGLPELDEATLLKQSLNDLSSPHTETREYAAIKLGDLGRTDAIAPLLKALEKELGTPSWEVRVAIVTALGKIGDPQAIDSLATVLKTDGEWRVCKAAAEALGAIGGDEAITALEAARAREGPGIIKNTIEDILTGI